MNIEIKKVAKAYGAKTVFRALSLTIPEGEVSCLMAPSGWGKTTLLRILLGLEAVDAGSIEGLPARRSVVFQEDRLFPGLSAEENLLRIAGKGKKAEAEALLARLGLGEDAQKPASELSGGMGRRVALARALLVPFDLLLLDEPFAGLDKESRAQTAAVIREHIAGKTVLLISHDAEECALLGGTILPI